jgi:hypothetical protein
MIRRNEKLGGRPFFEEVTLVRGGEPIAGSVQTPDGKPAAGVPVLAYTIPSNREAMPYGSFSSVTTDADGRFQFVMATPGVGVFWLLPKDYAPLRYVLKDNWRGELGTFRLERGTVIRGKVVDAKGAPVAGAVVNADLKEFQKDLRGLVADSIGRSTVSDSRGEFTLAPLPADLYTVCPDTRAHFSVIASPDSKPQPLKGFFLPRIVHLENGKQPEPLELRSIPCATIEAQVYNSKGEKAYLGDGSFHCHFEAQSWIIEAPGAKDGKMCVDVPRGATESELQTMTNEHSSLRWRMNKDAALVNGGQIKLGTVRDDVKGIQIIRYRAPLLMVTVKAKDGGKLTKPSVTASARDYSRHFSAQSGGRFRSSQLLPDEETTVTAAAEGYRASSTKVNLAEGTTTEIVLELEK